MSRYLFVVPPLAGHTYPTVAVGDELARRGHEVAWAGHASIVGPLLTNGARLFPVPPDATPDGFESLRLRGMGLRGAASFRFLWDELLIPLARAMVTGVEGAVDAFAPDVVVSDQQALAGALVARRRGLPWVTSATTSAELTPFDLMSGLGQWVERRLDELQRELDVADPEASRVDPRFSELLVLAFTTEALVGHLDGLPDHYAFVGPSLGARANGGRFPWESLDRGRRHVLVSLGTVNSGAGARFFSVATEALADLAESVQAVLVAPPDMVGEPPPNVLVREFVPQLDLLPHLDAVVCHAGHNTVCEALAHGIPLVVAPIRDDQPIVAEQVIGAGAGIRVRFGRVGAAELREAIVALLEDPSYRSSARRVQASFAEAGGASAAADHLERVA
jgi:MGT family glycosyltransferase